jgi:hypothetical protein
MSATGRRLRAVHGKAAPDEATGQTATPADEAWQRALATGDRAALLPEALRAIVAEAGRDGRLGTEIGALRVVVERLLLEIPDVERLATLLPRLTNAIVRALQTQRTLGGEEDDELAEVLKQVLAMQHEA